MILESKTLYIKKQSSLKVQTVSLWNNKIIFQFIRGRRLCIWTDTYIFNRSVAMGVLHARVWVFILKDMRVCMCVRACVGDGGGWELVCVCVNTHVHACGCENVCSHR